MKLTELWKSRDKATLSFELYPARTEKAAAKLEIAIDELAALEPDFVSVTFGAGGTTREGSHALLEKLIHEKGLLAVGYFAGYGLSPAEITAVLDSYQELGIENILAVRGDPPHGDDTFTPHPESFPYATDLIKFLRPKYGFCIGAAGYPEGHINAESRAKDLEYLKLKVDNGAEYIITNYTYDNQLFFEFEGRARAAGIAVPIIPGVMPIYSQKMTESLAELCGATIPAEITSSLSALPADDKAAVSEFGIEFGYQQCKGLLEAGVPGIHIYTMDRSPSVTAILARLRASGLL